MTVLGKPRTYPENFEGPSVKKLDNVFSAKLHLPLVQIPVGQNEIFTIVFESSLFQLKFLSKLEFTSFSVLKKVHQNGSEVIEKFNHYNETDGRNM